MIIAHRGASYDAPENTLAALKLAWTQGADAAEVDLRLSLDGCIVAMHDPSTRRTCERDLRVQDARLSDLRALDAGGWKGAAWKGEKIPTIGEILEDVPAGRWMVLEIKTGSEILPPLAGAIRHSPLAGHQIFLITFRFDVAVDAKQLLPECKVLHLVGDSRTDLHGALIRARSAGLDGLDVAAALAPRNDLVDAAHAAGMSVVVYTVDDPAAARRYSAMGVDGITTNRPGFLAAALRNSP